MDQNLSQEANISSYSQDISQILCNPKVLTVSTRSSLVYYPEPDELSPKNPILFIGFHFNIILLSTSFFQSVPFLYGFSSKPCVHLYPGHMRAMCPAQLVLPTNGHPSPKESLTTPGLACNKEWDYCVAWLHWNLLPVMSLYPLFRRLYLPPSSGMCLNPWWHELLTHLMAGEDFIAWTDFKLFPWSVRNVYATLMLLLRTTLGHVAVIKPPSV